MRSIGGELMGNTAHVLAIGAHADDIEIGCGGTLLRMAAANPDVRFWLAIMSAPSERADEASASAHALLGPNVEVRVSQFRDGYLPHAGAALKEAFDELGQAVQPDVVFTAYRHDLHQDHRVVSELTWNTFRDHLILEYEVPKYDGDLGSPNAFVELDGATLDRKVDHLLAAFPSQAGKGWFTAETFRGLARLRGIECRAASGYAEAFYLRKLRLA